MQEVSTPSQRDFVAIAVLNEIEPSHKSRIGLHPQGRRTAGSTTALSLAGRTACIHALLGVASELRSYRVDELRLRHVLLVDGAQHLLVDGLLGQDVVYDHRVGLPLPVQAGVGLLVFLQ